MKCQRSCEVSIRIILIIRVRKFVTSSGWVPGIQGNFYIFYIQIFLDICFKFWIPEERTINQAIFKLRIDSGMFKKQSDNLIYQYIVVLYDKYIQTNVFLCVRIFGSNRHNHERRNKWKLQRERNPTKIRSAEHGWIDREKHASGGYLGAYICT